MARCLRWRARLGRFDQQRGRLPSTRWIVVVGVLAMLPVDALAQSRDERVTSVPRTPWGHPDLRGIWDFRTLTPMERPPEFAGQEFFTDKEAAQFVEDWLQRIGQGSPLSASGGGDLGVEVTADRHTSLIVDPHDGRIPPLTPQAEVVIDTPRQRPVTERVVTGPGVAFDADTAVADGPEDRGLFERCLLGLNSGPPMFPSSYNNNVQVFQTPEYVVLLNEMIHNARIVPLDGRPHLGPGIQQWMGDSRGRWDGGTLIIDTTNFTTKTSFNGHRFGRGRGGGSGETFHVIERLTRTDTDALLYEFTVDDPTWWKRSWSAAVPMRKTESPLFEFACHEGNHSMAGMLSGVRADERTRQEGGR